MIVTPRKEAEHARLASAEEASRLKDDFLATLSHELRTPLNAILGWVQMLLSGTLPADRARQAIDIIGRNAKAQAQLIEDILDISRIITGKLEIETQVVSVPHLMDGVVSAALPAARLKQITISKHVPDGLPPIDGDPKRLHQVLSSVIANAIQFTPEKGTVDIGAAADGDEHRNHGARLRRRHPRRVPAARLRSLPSGRQPRHAPARRPRPRPRHRAARPRAAPRRDPRRQ